MVKIGVRGNVAQVLQECIKRHIHGYDIVGFLPDFCTVTTPSSEWVKIRNWYIESNGSDVGSVVYYEHREEQASGDEERRRQRAQEASEAGAADTHR